MKSGRLCWLLLFLAGTLQAHPGTGIILADDGSLFFAHPEANEIWVLATNLHKNPMAAEFSQPQLAKAHLHVHQLGLDHEGNVLAEAQEWEPDSGQWHSALWHLNGNGQHKLSLEVRGAGFAVATSSRVDGQGRAVAWQVDMQEQAYSRFVRLDGQQEKVLLGSRWRKAGQNEASAVGNVGDFWVSSAGHVTFTDHDCLRHFANGIVDNLSCGELLRKPRLSLSFGEHNHLRGLSIDHHAATPSTHWVCNYTAGTVVQVDAKGRQLQVYQSPWRRRPVGVFVWGRHLLILEHGKSELRVVHVNRNTGVSQIVAVVGR